MKLSFNNLKLVGGDNSSARVWLDAFVAAVIVENGGEWPVGMTGALNAIGFKRVDQVRQPNVFVRQTNKEIAFQDVARTIADEIHNAMGYLPFKGNALELLRWGVPDLQTRYSFKAAA